MKKKAEQLGFPAKVEKRLVKVRIRLPNLLLRQGGITVAGEITVTTGIDHEFENVKKCLAASVLRLAVISISPKGSSVTLHERWPFMATDDRRKIVEKIVVGETEIDITYSHLPFSKALGKSQQRLGRA